jgi:NADH-quinone oxidoreductase subunit J
MIQSVFFGLFSAVLVVSALLVIFARNPVHSVLFLILCFFNAGALFLMAGAEFLGLIMVVVYVGAVAVLFLFVVMMLDIDIVSLREGIQRYAPIGLLVGAALFVELILAFSASARLTLPSPAPAAGGSNIAALGDVLYTTYFLPFQVAGVVLLVAMIGAITLTFSGRQAFRRQNVAAQLARAPGETLALLDVPLHAGVSPLSPPAAAEGESGEAKAEASAPHAS